jgi:hypothetical protein
MHGVVCEHTVQKLHCPVSALSDELQQYFWIEVLAIPYLIFSLHQRTPDVLGLGGEHL